MALYDYKPVRDSGLIHYADGSDGGIESFEAWLLYPVPADVMYIADRSVQLHAWHLDQRIWSPSCCWCSPPEQPAPIGA